DAKLRVRMRSEIVKLHRKLQATMVYVTHDQVEAMMMGDRIVVMNEGRIQQVGTPLDVYNSPQNRFVAEFIGSPPMNVLDGQLTNDNDQPAVKIGDWTVPISKARAGRYTELVGKPIALGIRPEDIRLTPPGDGENWLAIESEIQVTQPLGAEWLIELEAHGQSFVARSPASSAPSTPTGSITSHWNLARCHLFDGRTGAAVMGAKEI
ncbi:MAG: ABC transporter ATP-binding protein, partial [Pirellulaceae bacterium]|nr:ABC transporter ATP-binding protein [Pirellulaceae bacterium]